MPAVLMRGRALLARLALSQSRRTVSVVQQRHFHPSSALLARRKTRGSPKAKAPKAAAFDDDDDDEDEKDEFEQWANKMHANSVENEGEEAEEQFSPLVPIDDDDEEDEEEDEETQEFLSHVDDLFSLDPAEFEKRMKATEKRDAIAKSRTRRSDEDDDEDEVVDRVTERIPKKKLLKALSELDSSRSKKNAEAMPIPKTKLAAPLEKPEKKGGTEKASFRQARVETSVLDFVQSLYVEDADTTGTDVIPNFVESSVSPDLRRIVLWWEPMRLHSSNQIVSKRKVAGITTRLEKQQRWVRSRVTRFLNLKYSPVVEFKQRKAAKSDEARALFDSEMAWLNRFQ